MIDMYLLLLIASGLSAAGSAFYLLVHGRIADWHDPIAVNAWLGGLSVLILSAASALFLLGHYGIIGSYTPPLATACLGFVVVAAVWIRRGLLVLKISHEDRGRDSRV